MPQCHEISRLKSSILPRSLKIAGSSPKIAIVSPLEIWSIGLEALMREFGGDVAGRWRSLEKAITSNKFRNADIVVVSWQLIDFRSNRGRNRPLGGDFSGKIVIAIDPSDIISVVEFVTIDVEGLIHGSASVEEVFVCIDSVAQGRMWVDPNVRKLLGASVDDSESLQQLSSREYEVAGFVALHLTNKQVARKLGVSEGTIKMHVHHALNKLHLSSRAELSNQIKQLSTESNGKLS
jgi:two-component system nitrate/nitrite response regulator NarL